MDKLLTITGIDYLERNPDSCQNFDEKQRLLTTFLVYFKEIAVNSSNLKIKNDNFLVTL